MIDLDNSFYNTNNYIQQYCAITALRCSISTTKGDRSDNLVNLREIL